MMVAHHGRYELSCRVLETGMLFIFSERLSKELPEASEGGLPELILWEPI